MYKGSDLEYGTEDVEPKKNREQLSIDNSIKKSLRKDIEITIKDNINQ